MFYISRLLTKSVKKGNDYKKMKTVIMITIFATTSKKRNSYKGYHKQDILNEYIEEGIEIGKIEIAIKLKNKGLSIEDIAEITCLNPKFIKKL